jgi:GTPase SAR1 family protein
MYLSYANYDFAKHSVVVGASGTGKSKLISSMIKNLSKNSQNKLKYKIVIIDPHAAMEDDIGGLESTDVIDFKTNDSSIDLFVNSAEDILSSTESIMAIFKSIIADKYNSKLERVLRYSTHLLLANESFNLINLRKLLTEIEYRNEVIRIVEDFVQPNIIEFFRVDFNELKTKSYQEAISPIISFIDEMQLLPALSSTTKLKNIEDEIRENFLTILSSVLYVEMVSM